MLEDPGDYTVEEEASIEMGLKMAEMLRSNENQAIKFVKHDIGQGCTDAWVCRDNVSHKTFGKSQTQVHGASIQECLAFFLNYDSHWYKTHHGSAATVSSCLAEIINNHHRVTYYHGKGHLTVSDRDFVFDVIAKKLTDDKWIAVYTPTTHARFPVPYDTVRGESTRVYVLTKVSEEVTSLELYMTIDLQGHMPEFVTNKVVIPTSLRSDVMLYFLQLRVYADYEEEDSERLAQHLMDIMGEFKAGDERDFHFKRFFHRTKALITILDTYPWFEVLLYCVIENRGVSHGGGGGDDGRDRNTSAGRRLSKMMTLKDVGIKDAMNIGESFALTLMSSPTPEEAVDDWLTKRKVLLEFSILEPKFFRPFIVVVAKNLVIMAKKKEQNAKFLVLTVIMMLAILFALFFALWKE